MDAQPQVFIVSADPKGRRELSKRMKSLSLDARSCDGALELEKIASPGDPGCILLWVGDENDDLEFLAALGQSENHWPVIGVSPAATVEMAVQAMKRGAIDFVEKSCSDERLAAAIDDAFRSDAAHRRHFASVETLRRRMTRLNPGHREVLDRLVRGKSNRQMADELQLSIRSIEDRRAKIMQTMKARSLADLIRQVFLVEGPRRARNGVCCEEASDGVRMVPDWFADATQSVFASLGRPPK